MTMSAVQLRSLWLGILMIFALFTQVPANAADKIGIFELIHQSSVPYDETLAAVEKGLSASGLTVHTVHEVRVPDQMQQAHVFVLTSPAYLAAAVAESPRTISAQILRVAVYTWGENQQTLVNMANPVAHAMVFYARSDNYDKLTAAAKLAADEIRGALADLPGESVSVQQSPLRSENHYKKFKGDGPARMMAKFRTYRKSQRPITEATEDEFEQTVDTIAAALDSSEESDSSETTGWERLARIPVGDDAVFFGLSNPYVEGKMIGINSRFRKDGKSEDAPYPGVDHVAALPIEVVVIKEDRATRVFQYGQMWRMQLYFWDSGYRAFTANVGIPGAIFNSVESLLAEEYLQND